MKNLVSIFILMILVSCGKDGINLSPKKEIVYTYAPAKSEDYSYEFRKRDCTTGEQAFATLVLACEGLKNNALNNDCAEEERERLFEITECPGDFS